MMTPSRRRKTGGFTLVELLVVVLILVIVAGAVIVYTGGLVTDSAETANVNSIKHLLGQVSTFYQAHGRLMPEGLDSMIRDDFAARGGTYATVGTRGNEYGTSSSNVFYCGLDVDQNSVADTNAAAKGVSPLVWSGYFHSLNVTRLTASDVSALNSIGITYVYDLDHDVDAVNGKLTYVRRTLAAGDPVACYDPNTDPRAGTLWTSIGVTQTTGATRADAARVLVFGIGPQCAMVGDRRGGMQEAAVCPTVMNSLSATPGSGVNSYYNRYMMAIRMPNDGMESARFVAILDANGWSAAQASSWATRTE